MMRARKPERVTRKPNKKCDRELEWCESCECGVPKDKTSLDVHFSSKSHKRKEALHILASFFTRHGLDYFPVVHKFIRSTVAASLVDCAPSYKCCMQSSIESPLKLESPPSPSAG